MNRFFCIVCLIVVFLFVGCSSSEPDVRAVHACVVFDYSSEEAIPDMTLSVFVNPESEFRRVLYLKVYNDESGLEWIVDEPETVASGVESWVGATGLCGGNRIGLPQGTYRIQYVDSASRTAERLCSVLYPVQLMETSFKNVVHTPEYMTVLKQQYILAYDEDDKLLLCSSVSSDKSTVNVKSIKKRFPTVSYTRIYRIAINGTYGVLSPPEHITK